MGAEIKAGDRVRICVGTDVRDPWLSPKEGWEGIAVSPALNMEATHWQVKFVEPWCSLGMTRIMPILAMVVIGGDGADVSPTDSLDVSIEAPHIEAEIGETSEGSSEQTGNSDDPLGDVIEESMPDNENEHEAAVDKNIDSVLLKKGSSFEVGALIRVKDMAGSTAGEEYIVQRRGMVGRIIRLCEIATSCVEVEFDNQPLAVMVPRSYLQPVAINYSTDVEVKAEKPRKAKAAQMRLPF